MDASQINEKMAFIVGTLASSVEKEKRGQDAMSEFQAAVIAAIEVLGQVAVDVHRIADAAEKIATFGVTVVKS